MAEIAIYFAQQVAIAYLTSLAVQAVSGKQKVEGPRIGDTRMQTSNEGSPQPEAFGAMRMSGNFVDGAPKFEEVATTEEQGGKAGGGVDVTSYTYFATVAPRFAKGQVSGIRRIWADTKLIWDISQNGTTKTTPIYEGETVVGATDGTITCYFGNQTQADPALEAIHGPDDTPAYIGECYVVFNRFDITKWGRVPNITAEVMGSASFGDKRLDYPHAETFNRAGAYDFTRKAFYIAAGKTIYTLDGNGNLTNCTLSDTTLTIEKIAFNADADEAVAVCTKTGVANTQLVYFDPHSGGVKKIVDLGMEIHARGILYNGSQSGSGFQRLINKIKAREGIYIVGVLPGGSEINKLKFLAFDVNGNKFVAPTQGSDAFCIAMEAKSGLVVCGADRSNFEYVANTQGAFEIFGRDATHRTKVLTPAGLEIDYVAADGEGNVYGAHRDGYISQLTIADNGTATVATKLNLHTNWDFTAIALDTEGGRLFITANEVHMDGPLRMSGYPRRVVLVVSLSTWEILQTLDLPSHVVGAPYEYEPGQLVYDHDTNTLRSPHWTYSLQRLNPDDVLVGDVARTLIERAQVPSDKIEVNLSPTLTTIGYQKSTVMSTRDALLPLCNAYAIDVIDTGYKIKVLSRGRAPVATIYEDELLALESGESVVDVTLAQESELPSKITVGYLDRAQDYQVGTQPAQRRLTTSETAQSVELPLVFDGNTQPAAIAQRILAEYLATSKKYTFNLPMDYLYLEPGDAVQMVFEDGTQKTLLLVKVEMSIDALMLLCDAVTLAPELYGELPAQQVTVPTPALTIDTEIAAEPIELPALDDSDSSVPTAYVLAYPFIAGGWRSAGLFLSRDGSTYSQQGALVRSAIGSCVGALPTGRQACYTDKTSTLRVKMLDGGTLSSTTRSELLNGVNAAAIITAAGEVEVIQFQNAVLQSDGSYLLSNLLNGRLGTEHVMDSHAGGERFVLLRSSRLTRQQFASSEINAIRYVKAVPTGSTLIASPAKAFTPTGRNLKPYSPVRVRGSRNEAGDLAISWVRRSRVRGAWRSGLWAPLGEAAESYEVEILAGDGSVKRVIPSATPTAAYSAADQTADFGSVQSTVAIRVYQLSAIVGRGFPTSTSI